MKSFAFAVLALLAVQSVAAFSKPVFEPKKPVYEPKKAVYVAKKPAPTPSPVPSPAPKPVTITCAPKPVIASVPATLNCTDGYKFAVDPKQGATCSKELCIQPYVEKKEAAPAKPEYKKPVFEFKKGHYFYGKKVAEKKPVYEPKKPVYEPKKPVYIAPQPSPAPKICRIDVIPAIYVCEAGYTFDKATKSCLISVPGPCPPTYTASAGVCSYTFIPSPAPKPVYEPKKPVYSSKGHYFMGKKMEYATPAPTPATLPYCVYPEPSPSPKPVKPVYEPKKPKYEPKKVDIKGLFSKLG